MPGHSWRRRTSRGNRAPNLAGPSPGSRSPISSRPSRLTSRPGEWADRLNSLQKYVVSSTLEDPEWTNVTILKGNVVDEVKRLKHEVDGDIVVYASYHLGRTLIEHDLVDELRLFVFPVVVGDGERLFGQTSGTKPFRLASSRTVGNGLVFLTYDIARDA
jgi:dihydrofolate reductase